MRNSYRTLQVSLFASLLVLPLLVSAAFPDVPAGHRFEVAIAQLVSSGVIQGNPDGNFYPDRTVNRAEMLKMLYKAAGKVPDPANLNCFPDVDSGSWYEGYVCDAAANKYVKGYADGLFKPANTVNRVEALKMTLEVLGIPLSPTDVVTQSVIKFVDVSVSAWYSDYLYTAYARAVMPIPGQSGDRFMPEAGVARGEAAAIIYNAMNAKLNMDRSESSSSVSRRQSSSSSSRSVEAPIQISVPYEANDKFIETDPRAYEFSVDRTDTWETTVRLQAKQAGTVRCTLFKKDESGIFYEYYIGKEESTTCYLLTTIDAGSYQLQIQPTVANVTYTVKIDDGQGDGNDGFIEAKPLYYTTAKTYSLKGGNPLDWYKFSVSESGGKRLQIELSNATNVSCTVYPMEDVDIFGFENPTCNQNYHFPSGTYYVAIGKRGPRSAQVTYTIRLTQ